MAKLTVVVAVMIDDWGPSGVVTVRGPMTFSITIY